MPGDSLTASDCDAVLVTLADLISINSVNPHYPGGPGEKGVADYVAHFLKKHSIPFKLQPVAGERANVIARIEGPAGGHTIVLEAHMDTASEQGMTIDAFRPLREGNRMYGRGSCDTKGGLAAMMHAMRLLSHPRMRAANTVILAAVVDEEYSFRGVVKFLENGAKADGAVVAEPTDVNTVVASKGVLRWRIRSRGRSAHSSKPLLGINAVSKMAKLILAMEEKFSREFAQRRHPLLGIPTLNVGIIKGGNQVNQVPDLCVVEVDRRLIPGETRDQVWSEFHDLFSELRRDDLELQFEMDPPYLEDFPLETAPTETIVQAARRASQEVCGQSNLLGVPYGSDASKLARCGIPSVILGPGSIDQAHAAEEYVDVNQVLQATEIYTRIALQF